MQLANMPAFVMFFISKLLRYGMFMAFLFLLVSGLKNIGGYTREQMLLFYLVFNIIDTLAQMLFREVYRFRPLIISGNFDLVLMKPVNPLVRSLLGGPDFIDLGILFILVAVAGYVISTQIHPSPSNEVIFLLMIFNSLIIASTFHIFVLAIGILTLSVDHLVMIYRDLTSLMRIPVDIFTDPLRSVLTFVVPVGIMFTFPAKVLFGLLSWQLVIVSLIIGMGGFVLSIKFWHFALKHYQSAGS